MKDIVITQARIKREFLVLLLCFVAAVFFNIYAIVTKGTQWSELFSQLHLTIAVAIVFYLLAGLVRIPVAGIRRLVKSRR